MPALSPTMETGTIAGWSMKEGDEFSAGDVLCSIETDKASVDFEAQDDGILAKILLDGSDAQDVPVGKPMCVVVEEAGDVAAFADFVPETDEPHPKPAATESAPPLTPVAAPTEGTSQHRTPSIRFLGKEGWKNRLAGVEESTEAAATAAASPSTAAAAPPPPTAMKLSDLTIPQVDTMGTFEDVPNNNMRKVIARRLTESKSQVPHFYSSVEVDLDEVMKLRKQLATEHDIKVSVNDLIIRSSALALRDVPEVNATLVRSRNKLFVFLYKCTADFWISPRHRIPSQDKSSCNRPLTLVLLLRRQRDSLHLSSQRRTPWDWPPLPTK
jgi:pyruvate dehydrogenase E2 component (dihydrolipoamide acetyltransferase)